MNAVLPTDPRGTAGAYAATSFWLATAGDDLAPRPSHRGDITVDVAILGGGFSGLWTAYYLLRDNPGIEVAVVEREICGFGASGRNGGWCSPRFPLDAHVLERRFGAQKARETILALHDAVEEIGSVCAAEGIDAHYRRTGLLSVARSKSQLPALESSYRTYQRLGIDDGGRLLSAEQTHALVHATGIVGGLQSRAGATVHPARLARGLAGVVERRGGVIFERSEVVEIREGSGAALITADGTIRARRAIVLAGEAYLSQLPGLRRTLLPMSSMIVLTAPLTQAQWDAIGWAAGESLSSQAHTKNYLTRTLDGRILYGSRGAPYHYGSRMSEGALRDEPTFAWMRDCLRQWWPVLREVEFTHAWGGYLGVPRDWMPGVNFDRSARIARLCGYTGRGVSTSALSARLLAGLIAGRPSGLEDLPLHRGGMPKWEPEPFRWAGVRYVQKAFAHIDEAEQADRPPPWHARIAAHLAGQ